jgi:hypothetical protein
VSIQIVEHDAKWTPAVRAFNERVAVGGELLRLPESPTSDWLPKEEGRWLFEEFFLAVDQAEVVRGGYVLKWQDFVVKGQDCVFADFRAPISEGFVSRKYPHVAAQLLWDALRRQPFLFGVGMGGEDVPVARLFVNAGWDVFAVPFFFSVVHPAVFFRNAAGLRTTLMRRCLFDLIAFTGLGWLGIHAIQSKGCCGMGAGHGVVAVPVEAFDAWADDIWAVCKGQYGMTAVRDANALRLLYPAGKERFIRLKVTEGPQTIGWAVVLDTQCVDHKYFGAMRLGSIVDGFAGKDDVAKVVAAAHSHLVARGVDLIVSNQQHRWWCDALRKAGYLSGKSNYLFGTAPKLTEWLKSQNVSKDDIHINRGDGDGPIHL